MEGNFVVGILQLLQGGCILALRKHPLRSEVAYLRGTEIPVNKSGRCSTNYTWKSDVHRANGFLLITPNGFL
jgi:hypothetical protein